jgi:hypothetical protein
MMAVDDQIARLAIRRLATRHDFDRRHAAALAQVAAPVPDFLLIGGLLARDQLSGVDDDRAIASG